MTNDGKRSQTLSTPFTQSVTHREHYTSPMRIPLTAGHSCTLVSSTSAALKDSQTYRLGSSVASLHNIRNQRKGVLGRTKVLRGCRSSPDSLLCCPA